MRRKPTVLGALALCAGTVHAGDCDFSGVITRTEQLMQAANLADAGIAIGTTRGLMLKQYLGGGAYGDDTRIPIASASKLLAGVRIMQLVDRQRIALDAPVSSYLPAFTGPKAGMTMRQMFSHTAGYGDDLANPVLAWDNVTLAQAVAFIACCVAQPFPPPGSWFAYGGISMHVGGAVAEVQGGEDWEAGWRAHVGAPLGITSIDWQGLGPTANYRISGGAQSSLPDYARVLAMLLGNGVGNGRPILSPGAIEILKHDQTGGAALAYTPPAANGNTAYSIGAWIEQISTSVDEPVISSPGAFGFNPWVDFEYGHFGVLMVESHEFQIPLVNEQAHAAMLEIVAMVRAALDPSCPLVEVFDAVFRDGFDPEP